MVFVTITKITQWVVSSGTDLIVTVTALVTVTVTALVTANPRNVDVKDI
jgi:hypothetical protein